MKPVIHPGTAARSSRAGRRVLSLLFVLLLLPLTVSAAELPETLVPLGIPAGIRLPDAGVVISALTCVETPAGPVCPARDAGLEPGDVLLEAGGAPVASPADLQRAAASGHPLTLTVRRGGERLSLSVTPVPGPDGMRLGVLVRDSMLGIGTLTYFDPADGRFGALGHGVTGADGGALLPLAGSAIVSARVTGVKAGKPGSPGELHGSFVPERTLGTVERNTDAGIFGRMTLPDGSAVPAAVPCSASAHTGEARILTCADGDTAALYTIRILRLQPRDADLRNLLIEVTDEALLERTGGIVQGMSGSPILQDGRLVGAVTHVLVNDPRRGYGILLENMLDAAG